MRRSKGSPSPRPSPRARVEGWGSPLDIAAIAAIVAAMVIAPVVAGGFGVAGASLVQIMVGVAGVLFALSARNHGVWLPLAAWGLAALVLLAAASMFGTESLYQSLRHMLLLTSYLLAFMIAANLFVAGRRWIAPSAALVALGFALSALGVREFTTGPGASWRVFATFANPNHFSGFLVIALPLTLALYLAVRNRALAILLGVAAVLEIAALALTAARFGIAAGVLGVVVFLGLAALARKLDAVSLKRLLIVAALAIPLLVIAARPMAARVAAGSSQAHSGQFRLYTWKATTNMAIANPLNGTGAGTFEIAFPRYAIAGYTRAAHQTFLQAASEMGMAAPIALLFALSAVAWTLGAGVFRSREDDPERFDEVYWRQHATRALLLSGIFGGLLASSARNMVDSDWYVPGLGLTFWLMAGFGTALATRRRESAFAPNKAGVASTGVLSLAVLILSANLLAGALYANAGRRALEHYDLTGALWAYRRASGVVPIAADYFYELGRFQAVDPEDPEMAIRNLRRAASLEPTRSRYPYMIGMVLANYSRFEEALAELLRARELDPRSPRPRLALAGVYEAMGRSSEALEVYREMVADEDSVYERVKGVPELVEPAYAYARHVLATDALQRSQQSEAIEHLEAAAERLERRRKAGSLLAAAMAAGLVAVEDEEGLHWLLIECHQQLAELYAQRGQDELSHHHSQRAEAIEKEKPLSLPEL